MTMLYIKYTSFVSCCCREDFFIYFHYKSMVDNDMPGAWPVWTPGAPLAAFIKENIISRAQPLNRYIIFPFSYSI